MGNLTRDDRVMKDFIDVTAEKLYELSDAPQYVSQTSVNSKGIYYMFFRVGEQLYRIEDSLSVAR